jgi:hypothetical protein
MSAMTDYLEVELRKLCFRTGSFTKPSALWIRLYTANPGETGGGTEVTGGSYAAVQRDPSDSNWTAASSTDGRTANAAAITFPAPTANWGTVTGMSIADAASAGNMLFYGALTNSRIVNNGDAAPSFAADALGVTFA